MPENKPTHGAGLDLGGFRLDLVATGVSTTTVSAYLSDVQTLLDWLYARQGRSFTLGRLSQADVAAFVEDSQKAGYSRGTINRRLAAIKRFSSWLVAQGLLPADVAAGVEYVPPDPDPAESQVPTDAQVSRLLDVCARCRHPKRSKAALLLMLHAGLNVEEVVALTWDDLELGTKRNYVLVRREGQVHRIAVPRAVRRAIEAYRADERGDDISDHVFVSQKGGALAAVSLRQSLVRCFEAAGLAHLPLRSLRGVFARNYLAANPADLAGLVRLLRVSDWNALKGFFDLRAA